MPSLGYIVFFCPVHVVFFIRSFDAVDPIQRVTRPAAASTPVKSTPTHSRLSTRWRAVEEAPTPLEIHVGIDSTVDVDVDDEDVKGRGAEGIELGDVAREGATRS
jgi:hypothetical protein